MGSTETGVIAGLIAAVTLGLCMVPRRLVEGDTAAYVVGMAAGTALSITAYWLALGAPFVWSPMGWLPFLIGVVSTAGTYAYTRGIERAGLGKATAVKNTQVVWSTIGGFALFHEARDTNPVLAAVGAALIVATALAFAGTEDSGGKPGGKAARPYLAAFASSVLFGGMSVLMGFPLNAHIPDPQISFLIGAGALAAAVALYAGVNRRANFFTMYGWKGHAWTLSAGVAYTIAVISLIISVKTAGVAVAGSLINLSAVVGVLAGIVFFAEVDVRKNWVQLTNGLLLALLTIVVLYYAKAIAQGQ